MTLVTADGKFLELLLKIQQKNKITLTKFPVWFLCEQARFRCAASWRLNDADHVSEVYVVAT